MNGLSAVHVPSIVVAVGPLPPPLTGTPISFDVFRKTVLELDLLDELRIVDSSPRYLKQGSGTGLNLGRANIKQAARILRGFWTQTNGADAAIMFGSIGFVATLAPLLLLIARVRRIPCFLRTFGGNLDQYLEELPGPLRWVTIKTLQRVDGVIVETELLQRFFSDMCDPSRLHFAPGYRNALPEDGQNTEEQARRSSVPASAHTTGLQDRDTGRALRLGFFAIVKPEKGIEVLLDSLADLENSDCAPITCTIHGSIPATYEEEFKRRLTQIPSASYGGVIGWEDVIPTLKGFDVLVHPTFYNGEGHPGVLIEAMMARIPAITTNFRSIPEVVQNEVNGLLVEPQDSKSLTVAIKRLQADPELVSQLGAANAASAKSYDALNVVPEILSIVLQSRGEATAVS